MLTAHVKRVGWLVAAVALIGLAACATRRKPAGGTNPAAVRRDPLSFLHTKGRHLVNEQGHQVLLRGCNAGNWLLIEPWMFGLDDGEITCEKDLWDLLGERFGGEAVQELIRVHRDSFFTEEDVRLIAESGMNCIRVPLWWRAVSDPAYGGTFDDLDRCVEWGRTHGVYLIPDLHGAPGGQSRKAIIAGERTDADLWQNEHFQEETVRWWAALAERYKDSPVIAGYDLLNEATDGPVEAQIALQDRIYKAVRTVDPRHIIIIEDGLQGLHRLPHPRVMGWENIVYSTHYYPHSPEEAAEAAARIFPRFNRALLAHGVPFLMGEFSPIHLEQGGADALMRYREVFEYLGWSWTFWSYKKVEGNWDTIWGLVGYYADVPRVDLRNDSLESIKAWLGSMRTDRSSGHPLIAAAVSDRSRWVDRQDGGDRLRLGVREAILVPAVEGDIRIEWGPSDPNIGFWKTGDTVAWRVDVPETGTYEIGLEYANASDGNVAEIWLDAVLAAAEPLANSGGWHRYGEQALTRADLAQGRHVIEIGKADEVDGFINLRSVWLRRVDGAATARGGEQILLSPVNVSRIPDESPIRIEWQKDPPDFGFWLSRERIYWDVELAEGGTYRAAIAYSSPNRNTRIRLVVDGESRLAETLPETGGWHDFAVAEGATVELPAGRHELALVWETGNPAGAGNLQSVTLRRTEPEATAEEQGQGL